MEGYVRACRSDEVDAAPFPVVETEGREVVVLRTDDGELRAVPNVCPHLGQPLRRGELHGTTLECPAHFYAYDLTTGRNTFPGDDRDLALQLYEAVERDGEVFVKVPPGTPRQPTTAEPPRVS